MGSLSVCTRWRVSGTIHMAGFPSILPCPHDTEHKLGALVVGQCQPGSTHPPVATANRLQMLRTSRQTQAVRMTGNHRRYCDHISLCALGTVGRLAGCRAMVQTVMSESPSEAPAC